MSRLRIWSIAGIIFVTLLLRLHNYTEYPQRGATSDEYAYAFLGISLLTKGVPISWSAFPVYTLKSHLTIKNLYFPIVQPYLDHPPLYGLLIGSWALLNSEDSFTKISLSTIRLVPIFLATVSSVFVFLIGNKLYRYKTGVWALLIFSTTTLFIMNMRFVVGENLLAFLMLVSMYVYVFHKKKVSTSTVISLGILSGLAFLTKIVGIFVFLSLICLLIFNRTNLKHILIFCITFFIFVLMLYGYSAYYDKELFFQVQSIQSAREIGPESLLYIVSTPIIINKIFYDGWYLFGFIALFLCLMEFKKHQVILVPFMTYFLLMLLSLTKQGQSGWYLIPLFPLMAIGTSYVLTEAVNKMNGLFILFILYIGFFQIQYLYEETFGLSPFVFRILVFLLFMPIFLSGILKKRKLYYIVGNIYFYLFILGNCILTYSYIHPA